MNGRIKKQMPSKRIELPIIGKIKIGKKAISKNGKEYPTSVDYFIPQGKYASLFTQAYGEKPNTIQIVFPSDDASLVCNEYYEYRDDSGALVAKGDGETFFVWSTDQYKELTATQYPDIMDMVCRKYKSRTGWRVRLTLYFFIPLVRGVAGLWQFETNGSLSSIPQIVNSFDSLKEYNGNVKGVIFDLSVTMAKSQKPNTNSKYPVVSLVANESEENIANVKQSQKIAKMLDIK